MGKTFASKLRFFLFLAVSTQIGVLVRRSLDWDGFIGWTASYLVAMLVIAGLYGVAAFFGLVEPLHTLAELRRRRRSNRGNH